MGPTLRYQRYDRLLIESETKGSPSCGADVLTTAMEK
jgi:hypothetical protein